ncbi:hypothetical protein D3C87_1957790 [compost metagenome]
MRIVQLIQLVAGPHPDIFPRALFVNALHQFQNVRHVLWVKRVATGEGNPLAWNARVVQIADDPVFHFVVKRQARVQPPGAFVVAAGAFVNAP